MNDEHINKIVASYKKKRESEYKKYHEVKKLDPDFRAKNREMAKTNYIKNKDKIKVKYVNNSECCKAKSSYYYYKKNHDIDKFKMKQPKKYEILKNNGFLK